jgi:hypothetical protein
MASPFVPDLVFSLIVCLRTMTDPIAEMLCFNLNTGWGQNPKNKSMQLWYSIFRIPQGCKCLVYQLGLACNWSDSLIYVQELNSQSSLHIVAAMIFWIVMLCVLIEVWTFQIELLLCSSERLLFYSEEWGSRYPEISYTKFLQFLRSMITFYF